MAHLTIPLARDLENSVRLYAMDTILDRALPDVRDGLKPVHRRILYAMAHDLRLVHDKPHKKSARIVGEVLGKYHPHGDQSVYDAMVRMAQTFSMRTPLIDGQGNFGSIDGDGAAAMRYTEARLHEVAELMLQDIDKDTVRWQPNFDDSLQEPAVLPAVVPNLLLNGSSGIAVAMATNIPPHNLGELARAIVHLCQNWERRDSITAEELMQFIQGPDFPTGGLAFRYREESDGPVDIVRELYESGAGKIIMQAGVEIEPQGGGKHLIVVNSLPYAVQKSTVTTRIGIEYRKGRIEGVADVRDESDHQGMRLVVETLRGHDPKKTLEQLLQYTQLRETFGAQMLALVPTDEGMKPQQVSLPEALIHFVAHRLTVIERRSRYEREKLLARLHIVEGLLIALAAIDEVIATIKKSQTKASARNNLKRDFSLSEEQASAIVAMPLGNLASLEVKKLRDEGKELQEQIARLTALIASEAERLAVAIRETEDVEVRFATPRRTRIIDGEEHAGATLTATDLVEPQIVALFEDSADPIERRDCQGYRDSGMLGLTARRTAVPVGRWYADPDDALFMVAADGDGWHAPVIQTDKGAAKGKHIVGGGVLNKDVRHVFMVTRQGKVKCMKVSDLPASVASWARVIGLNNGDEVIAAGVDNGKAELMLFTRKGQAIRFEASAVNPYQSPSAGGVGGITLKKGDEVVAACVYNPEKAGHAIIASDKGWLKRVPMTEWPIQGRNGRGVQSLGITPATGDVAAATVACADDSYLDLLTAEGKRLRLKCEGLPEENRRNRGVRIAELLGKMGKKDAAMADVGQLLRAVALSATYAHPGG